MLKLRQNGNILDQQSIAVGHGFYQGGHASADEQEIKAVLLDSLGIIHPHRQRFATAHCHPFGIRRAGDRTDRTGIAFAGDA